MTPQDYMFVVGVIALTLAAAISGAAIVGLIGVGRLGRWLRIDVRDSDQ